MLKYSNKIYCFNIILIIILIMSNTLFSSVRDDMEDFAREISKEYQSRIKVLLFKKRLAIFNFKNLTPKTKEYQVGETLSSILNTKMSESLIFILIDRENVEKIMKEIELGMTGLMDEKSVPKAGKLLGAELILTGTVSEADGNIIVDAKLISVETGEIIVAKSINLPRNEVILQSKEYQWSSFQSKYGISFAVNTGMIISAENYEHLIQTYSIDAMYRVTDNIKAGLGYYSILGMELIREDITKVGSFDTWIKRNYNFSGTGLKVNIDLITSILRWLNAGLRVEYIPLISATLTQDVTDFPVYVSTGTTNSLEYKRILVDGWSGGIMATHLLNLKANFDILISKRVSFNFQIGYILSTDFIPFVFESGGNRQWTEDIDYNGTFTEYQNFNFSRRGTNGERVKLNFSGISVQLGMAIHF